MIVLIKFIYKCVTDQLNKKRQDKIRYYKRLNQ